MKQYQELVQHILTNGETRDDRTGTGTMSVFGYQSRYDLREGFPLLTTKKVLFPAVVHELLWFLRGSTNIHEGLAKHTPIWDAWADVSGDLGPVYGHQWRSWGAPFVQHAKDQTPVTPGRNAPGIDQIQLAIDAIRRDPNSRRNIVSAWNVADIPHAALPPCHILFQLYVSGSRLDMQLYQRSADVALGVPFNIASYALLLTLLANETGLTPGIFVHTLGDAHIYLNHVDGLKEQLTREPKKLPTLRIRDKEKPLEDIRFEDIELRDYAHHPFIKFAVSV